MFILANKFLCKSTLSILLIYRFNMTMENYIALHGIQSIQSYNQESGRKVEHTFSSCGNSAPK